MCVCRHIHIHTQFKNHERMFFKEEYMCVCVCVCVCVCIYMYVCKERGTAFLHLTSLHTYLSIPMGKYLIVNQRI